MKERTYQLCLDGVTITVTKKRMKHMYLRIRREDGTVRISAPWQMSEERIRAFAEERLDWIRQHRETYIEASRKRGEQRPESREETERQKRILKAEVERLVKKWEPVMGVQVSGITIRRMKTRWGSCNTGTHHININLALAKMPPECLEYVVVHEMTHILEPSHSPVFWGHMTRYYPDWKRVRNAMRDELPE